MINRCPSNCRTLEKPASFYRSEYWAVKKGQEQRMQLAEMCILRYMSGRGGSPSQFRRPVHGTLVEDREHRRLWFVPPTPATGGIRISVELNSRDEHRYRPSPSLPFNFIQRQSVPTKRVSLGAALSSVVDGLRLGLQVLF